MLCDVRNRWIPVALPAPFCEPECRQRLFVEMIFHKLHFPSEKIKFLLTTQGKRIIGLLVLFELILKLRQNCGRVTVCCAMKINLPYVIGRSWRKLLENVFRRVFGYVYCM